MASRSPPSVGMQAPKAKLLVAKQWTNPQLQAQFCEEVSKLGVMIHLSSTLPINCAITPSSPIVFHITSGKDEAANAYEGIASKHEQVAQLIVAVPSEAESSIGVEELQLGQYPVKQSLAGEKLVLHGSFTNMHWAAKYTVKLGQSSTRRKATETEHRSNLFYKKKQLKTPEDHIARLSVTRMSTHCALVLEQTFGSLSNVLAASAHLDDLAASSIDMDDAKELQNYVRKNKITRVLD